MKKILTLTLSLCLTSAGYITPSFAAESVHSADSIKNAQPIPTKSYGVFIAKIVEDARKTLPHIKDKKTFEALDYGLRKSIILSFKRMAYATVYGGELDNNLQVIGKFSMDGSGKPTSIDDDRIKNILEFCEYTATFINNVHYCKSENRITPIEEILKIFATSNPIYGDAKETEFSYLQRLMLMRITMGYYKKLDASYNLKNQENVLINKMSDDVFDVTYYSKVPNVDRHLSYYWDKTKAATNVIMNVINKSPKKSNASFAASKVPNNLHFSNKGRNNLFLPTPPVEQPIEQQTLPKGKELTPDPISIHNKLSTAEILNDILNSNVAKEQKKKKAEKDTRDPLKLPEIIWDNDLEEDMWWPSVEDHPYKSATTYGAHAKAHEQGNTITQEELQYKKAKEVAEAALRKAVGSFTDSSIKYYIDKDSKRTTADNEKLKKLLAEASYKDATAFKVYAEALGQGDIITNQDLHDIKVKELAKMQKKKAAEAVLKNALGTFDQNDLKLKDLIDIDHDRLDPFSDFDEMWELKRLLTESYASGGHKISDMKFAAFKAYATAIGKPWPLTENDEKKRAAETVLFKKINNFGEKQQELKQLIERKRTIPKTYPKLTDEWEVMLGNEEDLNNQNIASIMSKLSGPERNAFKEYNKAINGD